MDRYWERVRLTWMGLGHISFGAAVITVAAIEADRSIWSFPELVLGGIVFVRGFIYLNALQDLEEAHLHPLHEAPLPLGNGNALVGIPLAPAEQGDEELAIEGLLLHHDLPGIPVPLANLGVAVHDPPVAPMVAEQGDLELAVVGLVLNDPPPALNWRDEAEQADLLAEHGNPLAEYDDSPSEHGDSPAEHGDSPAVQGDAALSLLLLVLHDPPLVFDWIEEAAVGEQDVCNNIGQAQAAANGVVRDNHLKPVEEIGNPTLVVEGFLRQYPPHIHDLAFDMRERDVDPPLKSGQALLMEEHEPPREENEPPREENEPPREVNEPPREVNEPPREVNEPLREVNEPLREEHALPKESLDDVEKGKPIDGAVQNVLLNEPENSRSLVAAMHDVLLDETQQAGFPGQPLQNLIMENSVSAGMVDKPIKDEMDEFLQAGMLKEPVQDELVNVQLKAVLLGDTVQNKKMDEAFQAELLDEPQQEKLLNEPLQEELLNEPLQEKLLNEPLQEKLLNEPLQEKLLNEPFPEKLLNESLQEKLLNEPVVERLDEPLLDTPLHEGKKTASMDKIEQARSENDSRQELNDPLD